MHDMMTKTIAKNGTIAEIWRAIDTIHKKFLTTTGAPEIGWVNEIYYEDGIVWYNTDCC